MIKWMANRLGYFSLKQFCKKWQDKEDAMKELEQAYLEKTFTYMEMISLHASSHKSVKDLATSIIHETMKRQIELERP